MRKFVFFSIFSSFIILLCVIYSFNFFRAQNPAESAALPTCNSSSNACLLNSASTTSAKASSSPDLLAFLKNKSDNAQIFLSPSGGVWQTNKPFTVRVMINSNKIPINAAESVIKFDPKMIKAEKITKTGSIFSLWPVDPKIDNKKGLITFGGGVPGKFKNTAGLILNIQFRPLKNGKAAVEAASSSLALTADGLGLNIFKPLTEKYNYLFGTAKTVKEADSLAAKYSGRILYQDKNKNNAWYINPKDKRRYYLGRIDDISAIVKKLGLIVPPEYLAKYKNKKFPKNNSGQFLINKKNQNDLYYIRPNTLTAYQFDLSKPELVFRFIQTAGLAVNFDTLNKITDWAI